MKQERIDFLREKLIEARTRLMLKQPFFALLLMHLRFVATNSIKTISTNGISIYFSPDYIEKLNKEELDFLLCHQIMHIIFSDIFRPSDYAGVNFHHASDIVINSYLLPSFQYVDKYPHLGKIYHKIVILDIEGCETNAYDAMTMIPYLLSSFSSRIISTYLIDTDEFWSLEDDSELKCTVVIETDNHNPLNIIEEESISFSGIGGDGDNETNENEESKGENENNSNNSLCGAWQSLVEATAEELDNKGESQSDNDNLWGNVPDFVERVVLKTNRPTIDWRKVLNEYLQEEICDYSFSPPDRRFEETGLFLPDFNEKDYIAKDILFMVDTSGSVDDKILGEIYSEIIGVIEQFNGAMNGKIGFFDVEVSKVYDFETVEDLMKIIPIGGGGTDFNCVFKLLRRDYVVNPPACVIIFTDGQGAFPSPNQVPPIPVLWILKDDDDIALIPPFGKTIKMKKGRKI